MALDVEYWNRQGRGVRARESLLGRPFATSLAEARDAVIVELVGALVEVSEPEREDAIGHAVEGYVAEHVVCGGRLVP